MALVPNGDGDENGVGGGNWTDDDNIDSSSSSTTTTPTPPSLWRVGGANHPTFCVFKGFFDGLAGGFMGSVFGFGSGLVKKQGFQGALREGGSSAKTFAILSGVHSLVSCFLKKARGKEDAWNAGIAGCATGLALSTPGTPQALAQSCLSFGAFSFALEYLNRTRPAQAAMLVSSSQQQPCSSSSSFPQPQIHINNHFHLHLISLPVLPPFTLPPLAFSGPLSFLNQDLAGRVVSLRPL